jgi:hypothetical protein
MDLGWARDGDSGSAPCGGALPGSA